MRQLVHTSFLLIIALRFTCGERRVCLAIKKSQNIVIVRLHDCLQNFLLLLVSSLTALETVTPWLEITLSF